MTQLLDQQREDRKKTLHLILQRGWTVVLLEPGTKRLLKGKTWEQCATRNSRTITQHLSRGGGIGLDVAESGVFILDIDKPEYLYEMTVEHWPLPPASARSPSGGVHLYFAAGRKSRTLPSIVEWKGVRVGEILKGPRQQVVMPPSPYPGNEKRGVEPGGFYEWVDPPMLGLNILPDEWLTKLGGEDPNNALPLHLAAVADLQDGTTAEEMGEDLSEFNYTPEELLSRARQQPGARSRSRGVKFQCPECRREGHDKHRDNAIVFLDGKFSCAYAPGSKPHRRAIAEALGIINFRIDAPNPQTASEKGLTQLIEGNTDEDLKL